MTTFVIRPFGKQKDAQGREIDFDRVERELIQPALKRLNLPGGTTGDILTAGNIRKDMFALIIEADLVICDFSLHNANVFYELGIRHALRKAQTVLLRSDAVVGAPPFDLLTERYLKYDDANPAETLDKLCEALQATRDSADIDSPVFQHVPELKDNRTTLGNLPRDLEEEIERARRSQMRGWLRLLVTDVAGTRFERKALQLIGTALWELRDLDVATQVLNRLRGRARDDDDIESNLALANLYERKYRNEKKPEQLASSDEALKRVLQSAELTQNKRAEVLALSARNYKTRWRMAFAAPTSTERRRNATSQTLLRSYDDYRKAFLTDLNHYWSGLAALQMGAIAASLAQLSTWKNLFEDEAEATHRLSELKKQMAAIRSAVELFLSTASERPDVWGKISKADLKFLFDDDQGRVENAYRDVLSEANDFARDSMRGQLQLFADLDIKRELAERLIQLIDGVGLKPPDGPTVVVVFAGHQIDEAGRAVPRFPASAEARARELIRNKLTELKLKHPVLRVLASAAPGSDILCHELCVELGIPSIVCLPIPPEAVLRGAYSGLNGWANRFRNLLRSQDPLQLCDEPGLPRWLRTTSSDVEPWERGNRWTLEMARSTEHASVKFVALWDGQKDAQSSTERRGGTAHAVQIASEASDVEVDIIDATQLTAASPAS